MKHVWSIVALLAAACAASPARQGARVEPLAPQPSAFHVAEPGADPETRRYKIKPEDLMGSSADTRFGPAPPDDPTSTLGPAAIAIRELVAPDSWDQDARRAIYVDGAELVVRHSPNVLDRVDSLIETMKANRNVLFTLKTRFVSVTAEELLALEHLDRIQGGLAGVFDTNKLQDVIPTWSQDRVTAGPKLTVFHAQAGFIRIASNFAYLESYEKNGPVYDPKPDVTWAGLELKVRAVTNGPRNDRWLLNVSVTTREIPNLPSVPSVRLGDRLHEMPVATENVAEGGIVLGPDQTLLVLTRPLTPKPARLGVVLIEAKLIAP